ncbi:MAG: hypothetical protein ACM3JB_21190 [Acidobacteriaceae bacterium]
MRLRVALLLTAALLVGVSLARRSLLAFAGSSPETFLYTVAPSYEPIAWLQGGERFPRGAQIEIREQGNTRPLIPQFAASADPEVSFDGKRVLFSGKKSVNDPWQIWEIGIDGSDLRQASPAAGDTVRPLYLPENKIVFARKQNGRFVIEVAEIGSGVSKPIFFAPGNALPTDVLRDGRVLFEAAYPMGGTAPEVYAVYPDGSGVESYRCDHGSPRYGSRQLASGDIVFTEGKSLARFTSPLAHQVAVVAPKGEYAGDIAETGTGEWLISWRQNSKTQFELRRGSPGLTKLIAVVSDGQNIVQPRLVAPRTVPNRFPSALHDWKTANLLALNVYTSKYSFPPGSVASVRLYTTGTGGNTELLGTAPVESDGSFFIQVPGDRPLKFELLDKDSRSLHKQQGWMWARSGEQRVCVGCHAGPEHAPENAVPAILQRSTTPADLTGTAEIRAGGH